MDIYANLATISTRLGDIPSAGNRLFSLLPLLVRQWIRQRLQQLTLVLPTPARAETYILAPSDTIYSSRLFPTL